MTAVKMIWLGSAMILLLLALRPLLKKWLPAGLRAAMWLLPALRLLLPFEPAISLPVRGGPVGALMEYGLHLSLQGWQTVQPETAAFRIPWHLIWIAGSMAAALYTLLVNVRFARRLRPDGEHASLPLYRGGGPCLFGLIRPRIVLPEGLDGETEAMALRHELTHYRRKDHIRTGLGRILLCIYWWNPLVWAAEYCHRRDCEAACDLALTKDMDPHEIKQYCRALVSLSNGGYQPGPALSPSARQMKERILNMQNQKKIRPWKQAAALALAIGLCTAVGCTGSKSGSVGIIGGADGPTAIVVSDRDTDSPDHSTASIGGADGPTALFVSDPVSGSSLSVSGEMLGLARFHKGECQELLSVSSLQATELALAMQDAMLAAETQSKKGQIPPDYLLVSFQGEEGMVIGIVYLREGSPLLRVEDTEYAISQEIYDQMVTLLDQISQP